MGRFGVIVLIFVCFGFGRLSAQVVECPGFLPISYVDRGQKVKLMERLLGRFIAILDLHGLEAIDEKTILAMYDDHPEQLLIKLSYLTLQCQMVVLNSEMASTERRRAVRRVFLDYVLTPANTDIEDLTAYVNEIAAKEHDSALKPSIAAIESVLDQEPRRQWQQRWFQTDTPSTPDRSRDNNDWSVIASSPRYEDEGWAELRRHQLRWPDVYFELDGPFDLDSPFYAVVAGRGLSANLADSLLDLIKARGMAKDAFRWRAPRSDGQSPPPNRATDQGPEIIKPTPSRPTLNGLDSTPLSQ